MKPFVSAMVPLLIAVTCAGCARPIRAGAVPVDARPDLTRPDAAAADTMATAPGRAAPGDTQPLPDAAIEPLKARVVADTSAARNALTRCRGRNLLPEQEATQDAMVGLLMQARAALLRDDVRRAESLARQAKQMSETLDCP